MKLLYQRLVCGINNGNSVITMMNHQIFSIISCVLKLHFFFSVVAEPPLEFCNLQKKQGSCFTREPRFFYEINNGDCLMFMYTGCNGNQNNFLTQEECLLTCHPTTSLLRDSLPGWRFAKIKCHKLSLEYLEKVKNYIR